MPMYSFPLLLLFLLLLLLLPPSVSANPVDPHYPYSPFGPMYQLLTEAPRMQDVLEIRVYDVTVGAGVTLCGGEAPMSGLFPAVPVDGSGVVLLPLADAAWPPSKQYSTGVCIDGVPILSAVPHSKPDHPHYALFSVAPSEALPQWYVSQLPLVGGQVTVHLTGAFASEWSATARIGYYPVRNVNSSRTGGEVCPVRASELQEVTTYDAAGYVFTATEAVGFCFAWSEGGEDGVFSVASVGGVVVLQVGDAPNATTTFASVHPIGAGERLAMDTAFAVQLFAPTLPRYVKVVQAAAPVQAGPMLIPSSGIVQMKSVTSGPATIMVTDDPSGLTGYVAAPPVEVLGTYAPGTAYPFVVPFAGETAVSAFPRRFESTSYTTHASGPCYNNCVKFLSHTFSCDDVVECFDTPDYTTTAPCIAHSTSDGEPFDFIVKGRRNSCVYLCMGTNGTTSGTQLIRPVGTAADASAQCVVFNPPSVNISFVATHDDYEANLATYANYPLPMPFNITLNIALYENETGARHVNDSFAIFVTDDETGCLEGPTAAVPGGDVRGFEGDDEVIYFNASVSTDSARFCVSLNNASTFLWLAAGDPTSSERPIYDTPTPPTPIPTNITPSPGSGTPVSHHLLLILCISGGLCVVLSIAIMLFYRRRANQGVDFVDDSRTQRRRKSRRGDDEEEGRGGGGRGARDSGAHPSTKRPGLQDEAQPLIVGARR